MANVTPNPIAETMVCIVTTIVSLLIAPPALAEEPIRLQDQPTKITIPIQRHEAPRPSTVVAPLPAAESGIDGPTTLDICLAYSPDGLKLAVGDRPSHPVSTFLGVKSISEDGGVIRIIDIVHGRVERVIKPTRPPGSEYALRGLTFSTNGEILVPHGVNIQTNHDGRRSFVYDVSSWFVSDGRLRGQFASGQSGSWQLPCFSRSGSLLAFVTKSGVKIMDAINGQTFPNPDGAPLSPSVIALSPDDKFLAAGTTTGEVSLWEIATGRRVAGFLGHKKGGRVFQVEKLAFSPNSRILAWSSRLDVNSRPPDWKLTSEIRLIDMTNFSERISIPEIDGNMIFSIGFSPDAKTMAAITGGDGFGVLHFWDAMTGKERTTIGRIDRAISMSYAPDGSFLVTANKERFILRNPFDGGAQFVIDQDFMTAMDPITVISPNGKTFSSSNGRFQVWKLRSIPAPK